MAIHMASSNRPAPTAPRSEPGRRLSRRALSGLGVAAVTLVLAGCWTPAQQKDLDYINQARRSHGRSYINGDSSLMARAEAWAEHMSRTGRLEHSGGGSNIRTSGIHNWCGVAENVAYAATTHAAHQALMNSPSHKANILGDYDRIGTGVARVGGTVWVAEVFVRSC